MIYKYFSHSFQRVSIVFILTASLTIWSVKGLDISCLEFKAQSFCLLYIYRFPLNTAKHRDVTPLSARVFLNHLLGGNLFFVFANDLNKWLLQMGIH